MNTFRISGFVTTFKSLSDGLRAVLKAATSSLLMMGSVPPVVTVGLLLIVDSVQAQREVLSDLDCLTEPSAVAEIGTAVPGLLEVVHYDHSDYVSAGVILAELESGVERAALALAEKTASLSTAVELRQMNAGFGQRTEQRNRELFRNASISSQTMDQVETESNLASLQVRQEQENRELAELDAMRARAALERRVITSPFEGSLTQRYKGVGEFVEGDPVFQLSKLDPLHVDVIVPVKHLGVITADMRASVNVVAPGFEDKFLEARVDRIDAVADAASATYGVRLSLPNPDLTIPAGVRCVIDFYAD